ncbi:hypothetical protein PHYPSEUDO_015576 [Phytophthora pseudosyringae]|uniref:RxLR effector PexRD54 WY domain-containing protein n=1 Tax=Phytophthora pseudosyringae TaxID=221518 RepID=A0A8T1VZW0_9STRA|nr:hypothetical protein PHYPSEUDO_015576 [Phytophthora pseudosyringae]
MRHKVAMLAFAVLVASIDVVASEAAMAPPGISAKTWPLTGPQHDVLPRRLLRSHEPREANEERAIGTSTVESLVKSAVSTEQLEAWLKRGDTADDVFKAMKLQKAGDNLLDNPQLTAWVSYMKMFNQANPTKKTSLITTLTAHFGNQGLTRIIEAGLLGSNTAIMAKRLQVEQVHHWMTQGRSPENVFGLLKLDKLLPFTWISSDLFEKPGLTTWIKYLDDFNAENPAKKTTLITILSKQYNDKTLANMLIAANKAESTSSIAKRIQAEQTQRWLKRGKKPADIFTMLKLDKAVGTLFENSLLSAWVKYADDFRLQYPDTQLATMSTLLKHYDDETLAKMIMAAAEVSSTTSIAKRMHSELLRAWLQRGETPDDIYFLLKLNDAGDGLLQSPLFHFWGKFMIYYNEMNPKTKYDFITTLTYRYGDDRGLSNMLMVAVKDTSTKEMATQFQNLQIARWLSKGKSPAQVSSFLGAEGAAADDVSSILYKKYVASYNDHYKR